MFLNQTSFIGQAHSSEIKSKSKSKHSTLCPALNNP